MNRRRDDRIQEENPTIAEYERRRDADRARAVAQHGPSAIHLMGPPELDLHDHLIDSMIEVIRYAQQVEKRTGGYDKGHDVQFVRDAIKMCREIEASMSRHTFDMIRLRQQLIRRRHNIGTVTKHPPFTDRRESA